MARDQVSSLRSFSWWNGKTKIWVSPFFPAEKFTQVSLKNGEKKHLICRRLVKTGLLLYLRRSPKSQTVYKSFCVEPLHKLERQTERERDRQTERVEPLHALKKESGIDPQTGEGERERARARARIRARTAPPGEFWEQSMPFWPSGNRSIVLTTLHFGSPGWCSLHFWHSLTPLPPPSAPSSLDPPVVALPQYFTTIFFTPTLTD